jgi:hypothetical protein
MADEPEQQDFRLALAQKVCCLQGYLYLSSLMESPEESLITAFAEVLVHVQ